jgi:hypothetical protein
MNTVFFVDPARNEAASAYLSEHCLVFCSNHISCFESAEGDAGDV